MSREVQVLEDDKEKLVKEVEKKLTVWGGEKSKNPNKIA